MGLPWFRMDSNIGVHDKMLALFDDPSTAKYQAFTSYVVAMGWSTGAGTDGKIPKTALKIVQGTAKTARLLEKYRLWTEVAGGWQIVNFATRQQISVVSDAKAEARHHAAQKANCVRHHGDSCWKRDHCSRQEVA